MLNLMNPPQAERFISCKTIIISFLILLFNSSLFSQTNTFTLGFTGMHPNRYDYANNKGVNWSWHNELNINTWQVKFN